jgi:hypothetical protein
LAAAQGGPPLLTDDPGTPGPGHWEINIATLVETSSLGRRVEAPRLDLNYGVGERIQLKFEMPWAIVRDAGDVGQTGAGNALAGVKWRFLGGEGMTGGMKGGMKIAWSIYPQFEFNTARSSVTKGIVEDGRQFLLPTQLTFELAHVELNGEVGRNFVEGGPGDWIFGLATEASLSRRLELLAEIHGERADGEPTELVANVGARRMLTPQLILLLAVGRPVRSVPDEGPRGNLYIGLQFNLPGQYSIERAARRHSIGIR